MRGIWILVALSVSLLATTAGATRPTKSRPLKTGQTAGFNAPGASSAGVSRMYLDLGNGVIKDQRTGLFWEKKGSSGGIHDQAGTASWSQWQPWGANGSAFKEFLAGLNTPPCFAGFCDWRLPTVLELQTLVDFGRQYPAVPDAFNSDCMPGCSAINECSCTTWNGSYWTATTDVSDASRAWNVNFATGWTSSYIKVAGSAVRAVRGGTTPVAFYDNGDGTISDRETGLVWEKKLGTVGSLVPCTSGEDCSDPHNVNNVYSWSTGNPWSPDGTAFTNFLVRLNTPPCFTGKCDWRLPTILELGGRDSYGYAAGGIMDISVGGCGAPLFASPCINPIFGPTHHGAYWASTSGVGYPYFAWSVYFNDGLTTGNNKTYEGHVRAVRDGP